MPQGIVQPNNAILYAGDPDAMTEMEVQTNTDMYPGRLVIKGTAEHEIIVATSASTAVLGVLDVPSDARRATIYADEDQARVLRGDIIVMLKAQSGATIAVGTKLIVGTAGKGLVMQGTTAGAIVAYSLQAKTGDDDEWILAKMLI